VTRAAIALCLVAGCGGATMTPTMEAPGMPALALVDPMTLQPIVDGASGQVIHGPQGGYHILVTLLAHGIWPGTVGVIGSPDDPTTTLRAFRADGSELTLTTDNVDTFHVAYQPTPDGTAVELTDRQLRLAITNPASIANEKLLLHADVLDRDGRTASDEKHAVAIPPTN
jgi:hypothetical protein